MYPEPVGVEELTEKSIELASEFDGLQTDNGDKTVKNVVTFDNPESMINGNGFVEIPIEDPEHLKKLIITADVTSSAGDVCKDNRLDSFDLVMMRKMLINK